MGQHSEVFVAFDVAKKKHAVVIVEASRNGEVRFLGGNENSPLPIERTIKRLAGRYDRPQFALKRGRRDMGLSPRFRLWPRLHRGRSGVDPETIWRAHQDEPARCGRAGAIVSGRRTDGRVDT